MAREPDHLRDGKSRSRDHASRRWRAIRDDAIMATGRSDYPNQVNNVLGFPYIFRGALDVRATTINMEMKIAAAQALAELAREDVPDEVAAAYQGSRPRFGRDYIIPVPFDPRLIHTVPPAVAQGRDGHRRRAQADRRHARLQGPALGPARSRRRHAEPHLRARAQVPEARRLRRGRGGAGHPRRDLLRQPGARHGDPRRPRGPGAARPPSAAGIDLEGRDGIEIHNARLSHRNSVYAQFLYERLQRQRLPVPRLPAHDQPGPQPFRRLDGGARRRRRHGDRRDAQLLDRARPTSATSSTRSPATASSASRSASRAAAPSSSPIPPSPRCPAAQEHRRDRDRGGGRRAPARLRAAGRAACLLDLRPAAGRARREGPGGGAHPRRHAASISSTTARWRPTSRSTAS